MSNELSDWRGMHQAMGKSLDGETAESWHKVHAQLLKSVADAQAKLLAGLNEICDKVESNSRNLGLAEKRLTDRLEGLVLLIANTHEAVHKSHADLKAALLAPPRRQVERLQTKRIVKAPPRKQRR